MTDPERLVDTSHSVVARELLRHGLDDAPEPRALSRVAATLGVTLPVSALAAPGVAAGSKVLAAASAGTAATGSLAGTLSTVTLSKWLLAGIAGGVLAAGAGAGIERMQATSRDRPATRTAETAQSALTPARLEAPLPAPVLGPSAAAPATNAVTSARARPGSRAPGVDTPSPTPAPSGDAEALGREAARIDAARRALAAGDWVRATRELDAYTATRVVGALDREAAYLRIQLLVRRGELERARDHARRYLLDNPHDAHSPRLRELLAEPNR